MKNSGNEQTADIDFDQLYQETYDRIYNGLADVVFKEGNIPNVKVIKKKITELNKRIQTLNQGYNQRAMQSDFSSDDSFAYNKAHTLLEAEVNAYKKIRDKIEIKIKRANEQTLTNKLKAAAEKAKAEKEKAEKEKQEQEQKQQEQKQKEKEQEQQEQEPQSESLHKLVTEERYQYLKGRMIEMLEDENTLQLLPNNPQRSHKPINPEMLSIGMEMALYHIEGGTRKFLNFCKAMIKDLGDAVRPFLKAFYNGARDLPQADQYYDELTPYDEVRKTDIDSISIDETADTTTQTAEAPKASETTKGNGYTIEPAQYTNKRGETKDYHLVKFDSNLSATDMYDLKGLAKELNGWYDRERGGFMMRSAEDAQRIVKAANVAEKQQEQAEEQPKPQEKKLINKGVIFEAGEILDQDPKDKRLKNEIIEDSKNDALKLFGTTGTIESRMTAEEVINGLQSMLLTLEEISRRIIKQGRDCSNIDFIDYSTILGEVYAYDERLQVLKKLNSKQPKEQSIETTLQRGGTTKLGEHGTLVVAGIPSSEKPAEKTPFKIGDRVIYTPSQRVGKPTEATIHDIEDGRPVLDVGMAPVMYEVANWEDLKPIPQETERKKENNSQNVLSGQKKVVTLESEKQDLSGDFEAQSQWLEQHKEQLIESYLEKAGNKLDPDELRELFRPIGYDRKNVEQYKKVCDKLTQYVFDEMVQRAIKSGNPTITLLTGVGGSGKSTATKNNKDDLKLESRGLVLDSALNEFNKLNIFIQSALANGIKQSNIEIIPIYNDPITTFDNSLKRGLKTNRWISLKYLTDSFKKNIGKIQKITETYPLIRIQPIDNSDNNGGKKVSLQEAINWNYNIDEKIYNELIKKLNEYVQSNRIGQEIFEHITEGSPTVLSGRVGTLGQSDSRAAKNGSTDGNQLLGLTDQEKASKEEAQNPEPQAVQGVLFGDFDSETTNTNKNERIQVQHQSDSAGRRTDGLQQDENGTLGETQRNSDENANERRVDRGDVPHHTNDTHGSNGISGTPANAGNVSVSQPKQQPHNSHNNRIRRGESVVPTTAKARLDTNIAAIKLMKELMAKGITVPTKAQMAVLRLFSGWGGLGSYFNRYNSGWRTTSEYDEFRKLFTEKEWSNALSSSRTAYYTPAYIIDYLWDIAQKLGFKGGKILEGSAGIGSILGQMPKSISDNSAIQAVEFDEFTGNLLSLLYPDAKVDIQGFQDTKIKNGSVDLAITNVPFQTGLKVTDTTGDQDLSSKFNSIHDFCIAKNIRKLKPGGIGIFISSSGTLDSNDSIKLRKWLATQGDCDVIGAFRLNNKTFDDVNASVTSDIIVVQKRTNGRVSPHAIDIGTVKEVRTAFNSNERDKNGNYGVQKQMFFNNYFAEHPENMGGVMDFDFEHGNTRFGGGSRHCYPSEGIDQNKRLKAWLATMQQVIGENETTNIDEDNETTKIKEGQLAFDSKGRLCVSQYGELVPLDIKVKNIKGRPLRECLSDFEAIKQAADELLKKELQGESDLQPYFDDFVRSFGNVSMTVEFATSGKFKEQKRFVGYTNLPELIRLWNRVSDTMLTADTKVSDKVPEIEGGKEQDIFLEQTPEMRAAIDKYAKEKGGSHWSNAQKAEEFAAHLHEDGSIMPPKGFWQHVAALFKGLLTRAKMLLGVRMNENDLRNLAKSAHALKNIRTFANKNNSDEKTTRIIGNKSVDRTTYDSSRIYSNTTERERAISDRSDIRVFGERLHSTFAEHSEYSTRDKVRQISELIIKTAQDNGLFIPLSETRTAYGKKLDKLTGESVVYIDRVNGKVTKVKDPFTKLPMKGNRPQNAIYEHIIHNAIFPTTKYTFEGVSEEFGDVQLILSQNLINSEQRPTEQQIDRYFAEHGFEKNGYYYSNGYVSITDVSKDNTLLDANGNLCFIDPIIRFDKPTQEVLDYYEPRENPNDIDFLDGNDFADSKPTPQQGEQVIDFINRYKEFIESQPQTDATIAYEQEMVKESGKLAKLALVFFIPTTLRVSTSL